MDLMEFEAALTSSLKSEFGNNTRVWVWHEYNGVKGFYGTGIINNAVVIWITERPSSARDRLKMHKFPDWMDKRFYSLLKSKGLAEIHFTDFVKIMDDAGKIPTVQELEISAHWMRTEIETLSSGQQKLIIIANSRKTKRWMDTYLPEYPYVYVPFFKHLIRFGKAKNLGKILDEIYSETL
ncbi:hypothetical protein ACFLU8_00900 [Chloroflexota bacterium]